jgi:hypothetical protein
MHRRPWEHNDLETGRESRAKSIPQAPTKAWPPRRVTRARHSLYVHSSGETVAAMPALLLAMSVPASAQNVSCVLSGTLQDLSMANCQIGLNTGGYDVLLPLPGRATSLSCDGGGGKRGHSGRENGASAAVTPWPTEDARSVRSGGAEFQAGRISRAFAFSAR